MEGEVVEVHGSGREVKLPVGRARILSQSLRAAKRERGNTWDRAESKIMIINEATGMVIEGR